MRACPVIRHQLINLTMALRLYHVKAFRAARRRVIIIGDHRGEGNDRQSPSSGPCLWLRVREGLAARKLRTEENSDFSLECLHARL